MKKTESDNNLLNEFRLREEVRRLKRGLRSALEHREQETQYQQFVARAAAQKLEAPAWLKPDAKARKRQPAIISAFLSDCHFDEKVDRAQVEGANGYDRAIGRRRLEKFFVKAVRVARHYLSGLDYSGMVLPLGGDILSGIIHEELRETNEAHALESVMHWSNLLAGGVRYLADEFGTVYVPCVVGNHGRLDRKPRAKGRVQDNLDWLVYRLIQDYLKADRRITVEVSDSADLTFTVFRTRYRLSHGDQFRGGSGIAGLLSPLMIGDHRKRKRSTALGKPYEWLLMGHWHQYVPGVKGVVVNGSLKGYDEYAYVNNYDYEPPQQAFWITDPDRGMTIRAPILVD